MTSTADVVVVGGGIVGAAAAAALGREDGDVVLLERAGLACAASGRAQGLVVPPDRTELAELYDRSLELHLRLAEDDDDCGLDRQPTGLLYAATDAESVGDLEELVARYTAGDRFAEWLDRDATLTREPLLSSDARAAVLVPDARRISPVGATLALTRIAAERGVEIRSQTPLRRIRIEEGRVRAVVVDDDVISTPIVIDAAGPWANDIAQAAGAYVPVYGETGWILETEPLAARLSGSLAEPAWTHTPGALRGRDLPTVAALAQTGEAGYEPDICVMLNQRPSGSILVGASRAVSLMGASLEDEASRVAPAAIARRAMRIVPTLAGARLTAVWNCARPATPDDLPIIDRVPGVEGMFVAAGHGSKGIATGPASGEAAAALVVGAEPAVDLTPFRAGRFADAD